MPFSNDQSAALQHMLGIRYLASLHSAETLFYAVAAPRGVV
jgi:hypothetical protein